MSAGRSALIQRGRRLGIPVSVHIDLLFACDLNCEHCYLSVRKSWGLPEARYLALLDEMADAGVLYVLFSGGELFLRRDTLDILRYARKRRFHIKLITHAGRVTDEIADTLAEIGVGEVAVSLYSMNPAHHEAVTRIPGSHARTIAGIRRMRKRDVPIQLKTTVMTHNVGSWESVGTFAEETGCAWQVASAVYTKDDFDVHHVAALNVGFDQRVSLQAAKLRSRLEQGQAPPPRPDESIMDEPLCSAGHTSCYVHPSGQVYACAMLYMPVGDLNRQSFREIWDHSPELHHIRSLTKRSFPSCQECQFVQDCGHCLAASYQETKSLTGRSTVVCAQTHAKFAARAEVGLFDGEVVPPEDIAGPVLRPPCSSDPGTVGAGGTGCDSCGPSSQVAPAVSPELALDRVPDLLSMAGSNA